MATFETEIRKLQPVELCTLARYLDELSTWKKLMMKVPKENDENTCLFSNDHLRMIEQAIHQQKRSGAEIFLSEWSTLNRRRPTCKLLLDLLVKIEFFKAADYLAVDVLKIDPPERPKQGPGAPVDLSNKMMEQRMMAVSLDPNSDTDTFSVEYVEEPPELMPVQAKSEPPQKSDMIKFPETKSDLIKFPPTVVDDPKKIEAPSKIEEGADDPKKITDDVPSKMEDGADDSELFGVEIMDSSQLPRCLDSGVYGNEQNTGNLSPSNENIIASSYTDDTDSTIETTS